MSASEHDAQLFTLRVPRLTPGRVRIGLDLDIAAALEAGTELPHASVAALRTLADQIDALERQLRQPDARPYDRIPLTGLVKQFDESYARIFITAGGGDPIAAAFAAFAATQTSNAAHPFDTD